LPFGPFPVTVPPDLVITTPEPGQLRVEFKHAISFFDAIEELKDIELIILNALGYGVEEGTPPAKSSPKRGPKDEGEEEK